MNPPLPWKCAIDHMDGSIEVDKISTRSKCAAKGKGPKAKRRKPKRRERKFENLGRTAKISIPHQPPNKMYKQEDENEAYEGILYGGVQA